MTCHRTSHWEPSPEKEAIFVAARPEVFQNLPEARKQREAAREP